MDKRDVAGWSALHNAALNGSVRCMRTLIAKGANVNARARVSLTPLHFSSFGGHDECVQILLRHGAIVDVRDSSNQTPLIYAVARGVSNIKNCIRMLLNNNADVSVRDVSGMTALDWAKQRRLYSIAQILEKHIAKKGNNPTHKIMANHQLKETTTSQGKNNNKSLGTNVNQNHCSKCNCKECINDENELQNRLQGPTSRIIHLEREVNSLQQGMVAVEMVHQDLRERSTVTENTVQIIRQGTLSMCIHTLCIIEQR